MKNNISNPRMSNPDGVYASEARAEDYFSLRDHFAGLAMQSLLSQPNIGEILKLSGAKQMIDGDNAISITSYRISDAMLFQRSVTQNGS